MTLATMPAHLQRLLQQVLMLSSTAKELAVWATVMRLMGV